MWLCIEVCQSETRQGYRSRLCKADIFEVMNLLEYGPQVAKSQISDLELRMSCTSCKSLSLVFSKSLQ